jgi:hypothetical protein
MARRDSHAFLAGITLLALTVGPAAAQDAPRDPARQYPMPTYEENWQFLRDPNCHADRGTRLSTCHSAITCVPHLAARLANLTNGLVTGIVD